MGGVEGRGAYPLMAPNSATAATADDKGLRDKDENAIRCFAQKGEGNNSRQDLVRFFELLSVNEQMLSPSLAPHELCGDDTHDQTIKTS